MTWAWRSYRGGRSSSHICGWSGLRVFGWSFARFVWFRGRTIDYDYDERRREWDYIESASLLVVDAMRME